MDGRNTQGPARSPDVEEEEGAACDPDIGQERGEFADRNRDPNNVEREGEFMWTETTTINVENMARDAFHQVDEIHEDVINDNETHGDHGNNVEEDPSDELNLENLLRQSREMFEGSDMNRLQCCIVLFSLCTLYSVPHTFVDALLMWIGRDLLPIANCFLRTSYELKSTLMKFGLNHRQIHCCPNGHILYKGDNEDLDSCPTYNEPRYVDGSNKLPQRVVCYFDIIKHLVRMFKCPEIAKHMTWYHSHKSQDHKIRSVADSEQWKNADQLYPDFAEVLTNLRLGLVGDGIIPFKNNALKHSIWVMLITIYNLPPWLLTKFFFISLAILIPRPKSPTVENIDVFLRPLVNDLPELWKGVPAIDMSKPIGERAFTLGALLLWTVNDFLAYGLLSGQQVHGYKGCPLCGPDTCAEYAALLGKMIYLGSRRYLPEDHHF